MSTARSPGTVGPSPRAWGKHGAGPHLPPPGRSIPTRVGKTHRVVERAVEGTVHPHARGENNAAAAAVTYGHGPSPRAWGKLPRRKHPAAYIRSIPTRVGKTCTGLPRSTRSPVHPHARGENLYWFASQHAFPGPSPRAWGKRPDYCGAAGGCGSIPTRVGKTRSSGRRLVKKSVHPHARGENESSHLILEQRRGPSPRAWGKRPERPYQQYSHRSIPTRVGKTASARRCTRGAAVHPHARGENVWIPIGLPSPIGPSPRAWGKLGSVGRSTLLIRSIPTRVGKTWCVSSAPTACAVHPHARGENAGITPEDDEAYGPSPRAWGKPETRRPGANRRRSIPTRVGKTPRRVVSCLQNPVHPHARGENPRAIPSRHPIRGPSPRAWGKRSRRSWRRAA